MDIDFFENNINTDEYLKCLESNLLPFKDATYRRRKWRLQQDNARPHVSKKALEWF